MKLRHNDFVFDKIYKLEELNESNFLQDEFNINKDIINKSDHHNNCDRSNYIIKNAFELNYDDLLYLKNNKKIPNYKCFYNENIKKKVKEIYKNDLTILLNYNINYDFNF
jgi:hypothetical protein